MEVAAFCAESRVLIVAGKGGVGKTTMVAATARMAADAGLTVLTVELEGKAGLAAAFGSDGPLDYDGAVLYDPPGSGMVQGRRLTPDDALVEYLADHGLQRVSKRLVSSGVLDVVATAIPGIRDVLVLGKVKQLERAEAADLVLVDAPATGHAVTFLTSAAGLVDATRGGPVRSQAEEVVDLLTDPSRCRVMLVTLPEEMPVSETVEAGYLLEDRAGVRLGPVIVNGWDEVPAALATDTARAAAAAGVQLDERQVAVLEEARQFRVRRQELALSQVDRLTRELPLPQLRAPALLASTIGPEELRTLAEALAEGVGQLEAEPEGR